MNHPNDKIKMSSSLYTLPHRISLPTPLPRKILAISTKSYFSHAQTLSYLTSLTALLSIPTQTSSLSQQQQQHQNSNNELAILLLPSTPSLLTCATILQGPRMNNTKIKQSNNNKNKNTTTLHLHRRPRSLSLSQPIPPQKSLHRHIK